MTRTPILLVGEISVDVTLTSPSQEDKMRLGGIVHAARGLWAFGHPYAVAAVLPSYLVDPARSYLEKIGCSEFINLGEVTGSPNITLIRDASEVADQGYEDLLREEKQVRLIGGGVHGYAEVLIFPGSYDLAEVCSRLPSNSVLHLDVAYDLEDVDSLSRLPLPVETIFISTSSQLFTSLWRNTFKDFAALFFESGAKAFVLKENRGGSRLAFHGGDDVLNLPAQLGSTVNSVGVGDVFAATYVATRTSGIKEAGWRATYAAAAYSQTTYPERFQENVQRDLKLSVEEMEGLGGVSLTWEARQEVQIYLAAPDFSYVDSRPLKRAIDAFMYHNFRLRRPIAENGELPEGSSQSVLKSTFNADYELLLECDLVFAVPINRDPGTLVEIGIALEAGIPVVVFDPAEENGNTMVMAGSRYYSPDLDLCLNKTFELLSRKEGS